MLKDCDYCDYDTCVALEEVGFPLHPYGNTEIDTSLRLTVLLYEAQKWLREEKQMILLPAYLERANVWICEICYRKERLGFGGYNQSYEEALSEGIKEAVNILKK